MSLPKHFKQTFWPGLVLMYLFPQGHVKTSALVVFGIHLPVLSKFFDEWFSGWIF